MTVCKGTGGAGVTACEVLRYMKSIISVGRAQTASIATILHVTLRNVRGAA